MDFSFKFINNYLEEKPNVDRDKGAAMRDISLVSSDSTRSPGDAVKSNPPSENVLERDVTHNKLSLNDNIFEVRCLSSSRANVSKDERNRFLTRTGIRDYDFPELVVFIQEENHDFFLKRQVFSRGICSVENPELDKSMPSTLNPDVERGIDSSEETEETLSSASSDSSDHSTVRRTSHPRKLNSEFESYLLSTLSQDSTDNSDTSKCKATFQLVQLDLENKNRNHLDALISRVGCSNECLHCAVVSLQPPEISTILKSEIVESFKRSTDSSDSFEMEHDYDGGSTSYPNHPSDYAAKSDYPQNGVEALYEWPKLTEANLDMSIGGGENFSLAVYSEFVDSPIPLQSCTYS